MVGQLIDLTFAIRRHSPSLKRTWGLVLGLAAAAATWAGVLLARPDARSDVSMLLLVGWFVGWLIGPILASGAAVLRPEYFTLLPVPRRRLAAGLLASAFVGVGGAVTALTMVALVGHGVRTSSVVATLVAVPCAVLFLVLCVAVSRTVYALLGAAMRTHLGVEIAAVQYGLLIATLFVGWLIVSPVVNAVPTFLDEGLPHAAMSAVLGWTPAGWPVQAVEAAAAGDIATALGWLGLLAGAAAVAVGAALLLLTPYVGNRTMRRGRRPIGSRILERPGMLPGNEFGAVVGKELRTWWRDPWRSLEIRSSIWFGLFLAAYGFIADVPQLAALAGVGVAMMVALSGANLYGQDGTALWQLVVGQHPRALRADVRGRQVGLVVFFGIPALVLSTMMIVLTGDYDLALPVLAGLVALCGTGSGIAVLMSVLAVTPGVDPHRRINATDAGENSFAIQIAMWLTSLLAAPTIVAGILLAIGPGWLPAWFPVVTVAIALVNAVLMAVAVGALALRQLSVRLPETFARLRYPGMARAHAGNGWLDRFAGQAEKEAIKAAAAKARSRG
ncbi:hypothetical protein [Actinopolymorpha pittospori]|uniref:ABC-2 type transport system permease protein n=1 Tax=Actinopolymorpha pittospori TaxID=648752 RepID=A0A927RJQ8_9ACTN|nr:hypothetical protein [Actinopolymorpha pittospori]MBE1605913.1 ABC-2 type transport system permease protein [Actinopolymorpha pittospori]